MDFRHYILYIILVVFLSVQGCSKNGKTIFMPDPDEEKASTAPLVTVIYGPNDLGDRSYCDLIYKGVEAAAQRYGVRSLQLSPDSYEQGIAYLETMFSQMENARDSVRRLFITPSPLYDDYIRSNNRRLENNPYADLLYMETTTPLEGKGSTLYIDYYGAMYMGGALVHYSADELVTLVLANPYTQTVNDAAQGFIRGFEDTPQDEDWPLDLHVRYLSNEPMGGFTLSDTAALRIYMEECYYLEDSYPNEVTIVPVCGGAMHALIRSIHSWLWAGDRYVGIDGNMNADMNFCLFSVTKNIDSVVSGCIARWLDGALPKHMSLGLADGASGVIPGQYMGYDIFDYAEVDMDSLLQVAITKEQEHAQR